MAAKAPREVAGLGRAETPSEKADRVHKGRTERRARQTMRNLVWSLLVSLAVMALIALLLIAASRPRLRPIASVDEISDVRAMNHEWG